MERNRALLPAAVTACLLGSSFGSILAQLPTTATVPNPAFDEVGATILDAVAGGEIPSMSVAVAKDGRIIWEGSFGWADRERMVPATPHTPYSMASVSKPLTATGLMILVERGEVELDAPVDRYIAPAKLTAYEGDGSAATVRHILNHTSGLPVHYTTFFRDEPERQPPLVSESIRRYGILVRPPGAEFGYSNFGYGLASHIIEKVSGRTYAEFMKDEVFLPLGMTRSSIDVGPGLEEYAAVRYNYLNGEPVQFYISDHPGASQAWASAHDLIRFGLFHMGHSRPEQAQILSPASIALMQQDSDPNPDNDRYGLGWFLNEDEHGYGVVWHTGSMQGANTILKFVPSEDIAVVVLINANSPLRNKIANDIIGTLLPDYGEKWREVRDRRPEPREPVALPPELLGGWEGEITTYEETVPVTLEVQPDGDVHVRIGQQMETLMNRVTFGNALYGESYGTIPSSDARAHPHNVMYHLRMDGDVLSGYVTTLFTSERYYGTFSSYIRLQKAGAR